MWNPFCLQNAPRTDSGAGGSGAQKHGAEMVVRAVQERQRSVWKVARWFASLDVSRCFVVA